MIFSYYKVHFNYNIILAAFAFKKNNFLFSKLNFLIKMEENIFLFIITEKRIKIKNFNKLYLRPNFFYKLINKLFLLIFIF